MKVVVVAYGSRGDVQPFMALAAGLIARGHECLLVAPGAHRDVAATIGVPYFPLDDRLADFFLEDEDVTAAQTAARPSAALVLRTFRKLRRELATYLPLLLDQMTEATSGGVDVVVQVYDELPFEQAHHLAERLGVPWVIATLSPNFVVSAHHPSKMLPPGHDYPRVVNRASHLLRTIMRSVGRRDVRRWRTRRLGMANRWRQSNRLRTPGGGAVAMLHCYSPAVLPTAPDWPASALTTGFLYSQPLGGAGGWTVPDDLRDFLAAGDPPVCVGFGSVRGRDPVELGQLVLDGVRRGGRRAVVVRAGGSIEVRGEHDDVLVVDEVPYSWLFPRVAAVVHGGGVGISSEAARAGVPQVCLLPVPEPRAWADVLTRAGLAPPATMQLMVTAQWVDAALSAVESDPHIRQSVQEVAAGIREEDGTQAAVRALETVHASAPRRAPRGAADPGRAASR